MRIKRIICFACFFSLLGTCASEIVTVDSGPQIPNRPNILWIVAEDLSPIIPPFGDFTVETPNLTRLAAEGVRYSNVFSTSGVCAPRRATNVSYTHLTMPTNREE